MSKPFTYPLTDQMRHQVATLIAAGLTRHRIAFLLPATPDNIRAIMREAGWPALLQSKRDALQALMGGAR